MSRIVMVIQYYYTINTNLQILLFPSRLPAKILHGFLCSYVLHALPILPWLTTSLQWYFCEQYKFEATHYAVVASDRRTILPAGHTVSAMNCPRQCDHKRRRFESYPRHERLCVFIRCGLATGLISVQGVLPTVVRIKKLKNVGKAQRRAAEP
jgi:hypothetical protein